MTNQEGAVQIHTHIVDSADPTLIYKLQGDTEPAQKKIAKNTVHLSMDLLCDTLAAQNLQQQRNVKDVCF